ncbi:hypothetical protein SIN8267_03230 [Sinobacterium norvegicum]|uniref:ABM domain-containing protein n=1 Tax=Sinobacterium norvegicum TaxID=1641715 RepID=A0ABM9AIP2_9GAMM|nr:putative quinol monooxygenase [Sinobacterium norvegicum]CAH0993091.1 hypothetical protein SIN8267_03230 [Sinobacterium norvegicum]
MTILIAGTVEIKAEDRQRALEQAAPLMAETRTQQGCRDYVWSADPTSETRIYVYENWDSVEDLAAHLAGTYYAQMLTLLGSFEVYNTVVSKFQTTKEEPVYDPQGRPRADFFT